MILPEENECNKCKCKMPLLSTVQYWRKDVEALRSENYKETGRSVILKDEMWVISNEM